MSRKETTENPYGRKLSAVEEAALAWFSLRNRGLTAKQEREFEAWLAEDPAHREILDELEGVFELVGQLNGTPLAEVEKMCESNAIWPTSIGFRRLKIALIAGSLAASADGSFARR